MDDVFGTSIFENYVQSGKDIPTNKELNKLTKVIIKKVIPDFAKEIMKTLHIKKNKMLNSKRKIQKEFELRLYERWKKPF